MKPNRRAWIAGLTLLLAGCVAPAAPREKPQGSGGVEAVIGTATGSAGAGLRIQTGTNLLSGALLADQVLERERGDYQLQLKVQQQQLELERLRAELERLRKNLDAGIY